MLAAAEGGKPDVVLMASGSEVSLIIEAHDRLTKDGVKVQIVSFPSHELFLQQPEEYRRQVLPEGVVHVAIEAAHPMSWHRFIGAKGVVIGIDHFGASAPFQRIYSEFKLTVDQLVSETKRLLA